MECCSRHGALENAHTPSSFLRCGRHVVLRYGTNMTEDNTPGNVRIRARASTHLRTRFTAVSGTNLSQYSSQSESMHIFGVYCTIVLHYYSYKQHPTRYLLVSSTSGQGPTRGGESLRCSCMYVDVDTYGYTESNHGVRDIRD